MTRGQLRHYRNAWILRRLSWMVKVRDCRHICLSCRYFDRCRTEGAQGKEGKARMNMKYALSSEDTEQVNVVQWAEWNARKYPELKWLHHCPNGGSRNRIEAAKLKQMGVKAGVSDLCLPYPKGIYCGLYIEMKYGNNRQQPAQKEFLSDMAAAGHFVATCYSAQEAIRVITEYLKLPSGEKEESIIRDVARFTDDEKVREGIEMNLMPFPNNSILKGGKVRGTADGVGGLIQNKARQEGKE